MLTLTGGALAWALWAWAAADPQAPWAEWADNAHWTVAYATAAWVAWLGVGRADWALDNRARRTFAVSLLLLMFGQLAYAVQLVFDWWPPVAPSDLFFLALGLGFLLGFLGLLEDPAKPPVWRRVGLDVLGGATAALAFALTLYLPRAPSGSAWLVAASAAYPVVMVSAAVTTVIAMLHQRQRPSWAGTLIGLGLVGQATGWMAWNVGLLGGSVANGSLLSLWFSGSALLLGLGSAGLRTDINRDPAYDRLCEGALRLLPLTMVGLASAALGLLVLTDRLGDTPRGVLVVLGLVILLLAVLRQTQQLGDRDRLLEAERAVAESRAALEHQAQHDALTGVPNLQLLRDRAERAMAMAARQRHRVALLFIDLDQFKEVNDTLGHAAGDALLQHLAHELQGLLRQADTVARQGGDEFCIVLPEVQDQNEVATVAEKVMALSQRSVAIEGHDLPLHLSVGIALFPDNAADFNTLMQAADTAMYRAKAAGRQGYRFYDPAMNAEAVARMQLRSRLSKALERGELSLRYQPQVDLASGRVVGVETLMRWNSAEWGPVSPAQFIPVAEDSGLIVEMGAWALFESCRQASTWMGMGLPLLRVAVNISVLQFRRSRLDEQVTEALALTGLPAECLELEVTESVMMQEQDAVIATLDRLGAMGIGLSIDDFGTGYSSLSYLKRLRVNKLKIDQSFVRDATESEGAAGIVRAVVQMAKALGLSTLAEGVETEAQRDLLIACGCEGAQGYLFAKPLTADELTTWLRQQPPLPTPPETTRS
ncbi:MAG: putative bifunctional diguanylate cyclase/phosphodiesterase [Inhella sp.]